MDIKIPETNNPRSGAQILTTPSLLAKEGVDIVAPIGAGRSGTIEIPLNAPPSTAKINVSNLGAASSDTTVKDETKYIVKSDNVMDDLFAFIKALNLDSKQTAKVLETFSRYSSKASTGTLDITNLGKELVDELMTVISSSRNVPTEAKAANAINVKSKLEPALNTPTNNEETSNSVITKGEKIFTAPSTSGDKTIIVGIDPVNLGEQVTEIDLNNDNLIKKILSYQVATIIERTLSEAKNSSEVITATSLSELLKTNILDLIVTNTPILAIDNAIELDKKVSPTGPNIEHPEYINNTFIHKDTGLFTIEAKTSGDSATKIIDSTSDITISETYQFESTTPYRGILTSVKRKGDLIPDSAETITPPFNKRIFGDSTHIISDIAAPVNKRIFFGDSTYIIFDIAAPVNKRIFGDSTHIISDIAAPVNKRIFFGDSIIIIISQISELLKTNVIEHAWNATETDAGISKRTDRLDSEYGNVIFLTELSILREDLISKIIELIRINAPTFTDDGANTKNETTLEKKLEKFGVTSSLPYSTIIRDGDTTNGFHSYDFSSYSKPTSIISYDASGNLVTPLGTISMTEALNIRKNGDTLLNRKIDENLVIMMNTPEGELISSALNRDTLSSNLDENLATLIPTLTTTNTTYYEALTAATIAGGDNHQQIDLMNQSVKRIGANLNFMEVLAYSLLPGSIVNYALTLISPAFTSIINAVSSTGSTNAGNGAIDVISDVGQIFSTLAGMRSTINDIQYWALDDFARLLTKFTNVNTWLSGLSSLTNFRGRSIKDFGISGALNLGTIGEIVGIPSLQFGTTFTVLTAYTYNQKIRNEKYIKSGIPAFAASVNNESTELIDVTTASVASIAGLEPLPPIPLNFNGGSSLILVDAAVLTAELNPINTRKVFSASDTLAVIKANATPISPDVNSDYMKSQHYTNVDQQDVISFLNDKDYIINIKSTNTKVTGTTNLETELKDRKSAFDNASYSRIGSVYVNLLDGGQISPALSKNPAYIPFQFNPDISESGVAARYQAFTTLGRIGSLQTFLGTENLTITLTTNYYATVEDKTAPFYDPHGTLGIYDMKTVQMIELAYRSLVYPYYDTSNSGTYTYYKPPIVKVIMGDPSNNAPTKMQGNAPYTNLLCYPQEMIDGTSLDKYNNQKNYKTFVAGNVTITKSTDTPYYIHNMHPLDHFGFNVTVTLVEVTQSYADVYPNFKNYSSAILANI